MRWTSTTSLKSSSSIFAKLLSRRMPALFTRMSTRPHSVSTASTIARTAPKSVTDAPLAIALPPAARISSATAFAAVGVPPLPSSVPPRSLTTTAAPRAASANACWRPRPPPAPVTIATRPSNRIVILCCPVLVLNGLGARASATWRSARARAAAGRLANRRLAGANRPRRCAGTRARLRLGNRLDDAVGVLEGNDLARHRFGSLRRLVAPCTQRARRRFLALADEAEVDLAAVEVYPADLHPDARADDVANPRPLAAQLLAHFVEAEILAAELGDVDQALDVQAVELHEEAEAGHRADGAAELLAQVLAHVAALEPGLDVARSLVGAALVGAAVRAGDLPRLELAARRERRQRRRARLGVLRALHRLGEARLLG